MYKIKQFIFFLNLIYSYNILSISIVYNMRVRRSLTIGIQSILNLEHKKSSLTVITEPIVYNRKRHIVECENNTDVFEDRLLGGALFNIIYVPSKKWIFEVTTAAARENLKSCGTANFDVSRSGLDDIVFFGGRYFYPTNKIQIVLFGMVGFPTKRSLEPFERHEPLIGTRFFGMAAGWEFSYIFTNEIEKSLFFVFQNRFLHFFDRKYDPILPCDAKLQPGNVTDLLFGLRMRRHKNIFEVGYNPTFFTNRAVIYIDHIIKDDPYVRNGYYAAYARLIPDFPVIHKPGSISVGFTFAHSKRFDLRNMDGWINFTAIF